MAQDAPSKVQNTKEEPKEPKKQGDFIGKKPVDYSRVDDLDFELDEDKCHLVDQSNVTKTNKQYHIDPEASQSSNNNDANTNTNTSNDANTKSEESKSADTVNIFHCILS